VFISAIGRNLPTFELTNVVYNHYAMKMMHKTYSKTIYNYGIGLKMNENYLLMNC